MKILCAGGGTAGHVYPVLAIVDNLRAMCRQGGGGLEIEWLGRRRGISRKLVEAAGIRHRQVASGQIRAVNPLIQALSLIRVGVGILQSLWLVARFRPDFCLATGGNAAAPGAIAAFLLRIPLLIFMPDASPGITDRLLIRLARKVFVANEEALPYAFDKGEVTGYPVRNSLVEATRNRVQARQSLQDALGLEALTFTCPNGKFPLLLLVSGGSLGARSLNNAILDCLGSLLNLCVLLLVTGEGEYSSVAARAKQLDLTQTQRCRLKVVPYLHSEFAVALATADLAVMRSGASVLGELPVTCTPAVLVPLPGSGGHQWANAHALMAKGACLVLDNSELPEQLWPTLERLLQQPEKLKEMEQRLCSMACPDGAMRGAKAILDTIQSLSRSA